MVRTKRRTGDVGQAVRDAAGRVLACGSFFQSDFELPAEIGTQLSINGQAKAYGNGGGFSQSALESALAEYPAMKRMSADCIRKLSLRRRFILMCGITDRCVAILGCINELVKCGITKIIITADTVEERENLYETLSLMRASLDGISAACYRTSGSPAQPEDNRHEAASETVCAFLTSEPPAVMIIGQASFNRECNIIRRGGDLSLAARISNASPALITSSETVSSSRSMSASAEKIFSPIITLCVTGEVRPLRDAIIFTPSAPSPQSSKSIPPLLNQLEL